MFKSKMLKHMYLFFLMLLLPGCTCSCTCAVPPRTVPTQTLQRNNGQLDVLNDGMQSMYLNEGTYIMHCFKSAPLLASNAFRFRLKGFYSVCITVIILAWDKLPTHMTYVHMQIWTQVSSTLIPNPQNTLHW